MVTTQPEPARLSEQAGFFLSPEVTRLQIVGGKLPVRLDDGLPMKHSKLIAAVVGVHVLVVATAAPPDRHPSDHVANGRRLFVQHCAACHGAKGEGIDNGAPSLIGQTELGKLASRVSAGGDRMPRMQGMLSDQEIQDICEFIVAGLPAR